MMPAIELGPAAREEFDEASDWYGEHAAELRSEFILTINKTLTQIRRLPLSFPVVYGHEIRRALVPTFPFAIFFEHEDSRIYIHAIFHTSRNPMIWRGRIN
ncbi:MAG: type II toxin-antitoxin system RelE/ParE family toxin [Chloracidobacterium sp.]|nr:type II toxin-antitoxin system RelE/ParE family toxin [Chloracidobacterium sp.]